MKVISYLDVEPKHFEGEAVKGIDGRVVIGKADGADHFCMRVFEVEAAGFTPQHTHDWEHEIFFHQGHGEVLTGDQWQPVAPGSVAFIPGQTLHQIRNSGEKKLVFVCLVPAGAPEI